MGLIMRTYHSSVFPLRKTLLALTIGAITHSAAAAESKKSEETMVVQATPASDFKAGGDLVVPAYHDGQVANEIGRAHV